MQFYIGDEPTAQFEDSNESHVIRTMIESVPDETEMHSILLDSGADGTLDYMRAVRQRYAPRGVADETVTWKRMNQKMTIQGQQQA